MELFGCENYQLDESTIYLFKAYKLFYNPLQTSIFAIMLTQQFTLTKAFQRLFVPQGYDVTRIRSTIYLELLFKL